MSEAIGITLDGTSYKVGIKYPEMSRNFELKEGGNTGTAITGRDIRDIYGTNYSYEMTVLSLPDCQQDYDDFYYAVTEPVPYHTVTLPFGQSTITFEAKIESGNDKFKGFYKNEYIWDELSITFTPITPQRR